MAKQLSKARISHNIQMDIKRMRNLLTAIEKKPEIHEYITNTPKVALHEYGIDLSKYATPNFGEEDMLGDIIRIVNEIVDGELERKFKDFVKLYCKTSLNRRTGTECKYNFNHDSQTSQDYDQFTSTERGAFSKTTKGVSTGTNYTFAGPGVVELKKALQGPMISEVAVELILSQVQKTLNYAESQSIGPNHG